MGELWGMSVGRYAGHRVGQYFVRGCEVWRCRYANRKSDDETSELKAAFATKRDAREWAAHEERSQVMPTYDDLQAKLSGLHFSQETLSRGEREILHLAEAMLKQRDAALLAATQEIERLRFYETTSAADAIRMLNESRAECEGLRDAVRRLRKSFAVQLATSEGCIYCEHDGCLASIDWPLIADSKWEVDGCGWWFCPVHAVDAIRHAAGLGE